MKDKNESKDLIGQRFGRLTVVSIAETGRYKSGGKYIKWNCLCDCGTIKAIKTSDFKYGRTISCGCAKAETSSKRNRLDVIGKTFGDLTVESEAGRVRGCITWNCVCTCGNKRVVRGFDLVHGKITSCQQCVKKRTSRMVNGGHRSRLYTCWNHMKSRCYNVNDKSYSYYGGRGIVVCDEWKNSYKAFSDWALANGYSNELSLDRINVNGNYNPDNCRWATFKQQMNNTRANRILEHNGECHTVSEWADIIGIKSDIIYCRLHHGWSVDRALTQEVKR